jgi:hypothetical protein
MKGLSLEILRMTNGLSKDKSLRRDMKNVINCINILA